jgi:branched-chain amino acid transport system permease protein
MAIDTQKVQEISKSKSGSRLPLFGAAIALIVALLLPSVLNSANSSVYVYTMLYAIVAVGLSLLIGYAGQVSLGQAVFVAVGAYTAAILSAHGVPTILAFILAPFVSMMVALIVGIPLLTLRGNYLAFGTLALQLIILGVVANTTFLGGSLGIPSIPQLGLTSSLQLGSAKSYAWLSLVLLVGVLIVSRNLINSRPGRGLRALATTEIGAAAAGVPVGRYRLYAFLLSAAYGGIAGAVYAFFTGFISPNSFSVLLSIEFIVMIMVGGSRSIWGAVVGAFIISILVQVLNTLGTLHGLPNSMPAIFSYAAYGLLLVVIIRYMPDGIVAWFGKRLGRLTTASKNLD